MVNVRETAILDNFCQGQTGLQEQALGMLQTQMEQILMGSKPELLTKEPGKMRGREMGVVRHFCDRDWLSQMK